MKFFLLKGKLEMLEKKLTDQMIVLDVKADHWTNIDEEAKNLLKSNNHVVFVDVIGKKFQTKLDTTLSIKDTLFYKLILTKNINTTNEIFIDRDNQNFHIILCFLRKKKENLNGNSTKTLRKIREETELYQLSYLANIDKYLFEVYFVKFEHNVDYVNGGTTARTQKIEHLNDHEDKTLKNGICAISLGRITIEIKRERAIEFDEIKIAGWAGNTVIWATSNGGGSKVLTSTDSNFC